MDEAAAFERGEAQSVDEYRIVRRLGSDPRGTTFLAHDRTLERPVVLSFIAGTADASLAGARAIARVMHPNLCRVHRVCDAVARRYVVSAFARGRRLDSLVGSLSGERALEIGRALIGAVATMHATGVAHGDIRPERVMLSEEGEPQLFGLERARAGADESLRRSDVMGLVRVLESIGGPDFRATLDGLSGRGFSTVDELRAALETLRPRDVAPEPAGEESPYRGLRPFEAAHSRVFFGRAGEIGELLARLRETPVLLIAGRSGTGKSSLVRAGIAPEVSARKLGERDAWDVATILPGQRPLEALVATLSPLFGREPGELGAALRRSPGLAGALARGRTDRGLFLIVDQLEEVLTLADGAEREIFAEVVGHLCALAPGVRVAMTIRSDFLGRLGELGPLGADLLRATYVLPPMGREGLREAMEGPARARGFAFETEAMVESLLGEVAGKAESLPLLSFALAELWLARDQSRRVLPASALERLGCAAAALARHGDTVLATFGPGGRADARQILLALVTANETRARPTEEALIASVGERARLALDALVRGRLIVAGETLEIAHEALVHVWPRLRSWLDEASGARAASVRLDAAAREWVRLGRGAEGLAGDRLLRDLEMQGAMGGASVDARAFVEQSRAAVRRARARRLALRVGAPAGALLLAAAGAGAIHWGERRQAHAFVAARLAEAAPAIRAVRDLDAEIADARAGAFARYDAGDAAGGESRWRSALALARRESDAFVAAGAPLGLALGRDPLSREARATAADLDYDWFLAAERGHEPDVARDLLARLSELDDDGSRRARLAAPARLRVTTAPPGARVVLHVVRVEADGRRAEDAGRAIARDAELALAPGSYVLEASAPGRYSTRLPVLLARGQDERVEIPLPASASVPPGFVYVPAGVSLLGAAEVEGVRSALLAEPEHPVHVDAFLIGQHEVTYAEYLDFLASLPAAERASRRPHATALDLTYDRDGIPVLKLGAATARRGDPLCREKRSVRRCQDWLRFPVAGIAWEDAGAYMAWLAGGTVPGARLCSEREWERAARGADGRLYPHGDVLHPGDANYEATYGADGAQMGADEIESFPADRSPFAVLDLGGNVAEWVGLTPPARVARGGVWRAASFNARADYRNVHNGARFGIVGVRACVSAPKAP